MTMVNKREKGCIRGNSANFGKSAGVVWALWIIENGTPEILLKYASQREKLEKKYRGDLM